MSIGKVTIVRSDDWEGVYLDGKLLDQGHSLQLGNVLALLGIAVEQFSVEPKGSEHDFWLWKSGVLPDTLDEVLALEANNKGPLK